MASSSPGTTNARTAAARSARAGFTSACWSRSTATAHVRALAYDEHVTNIVCSWHGYEFDLKTGINQGSDKIRLRKAKLEEKDGNIYVVV